MSLRTRVLIASGAVMLTVAPGIAVATTGRGGAAARVA
jgi:hypothetical protein